MSIFQQILLATNEAPDVAPPVEVPSGDPFIIDLNFPGSISGIPLTAVYTFDQAVSFPLDESGLPFEEDSGSTITFDGDVGGFQYNFYMRPPDGTSTDELPLILTSAPVEPNRTQVHPQKVDLIWTNAHFSGGSGSPAFINGIITFYAGEQLFLKFYYSDGGAGTAANLSIHLVGTAV